METTNQPFPWLELIEHPAFCVKEHKIVAVNSAARKHTLQTGIDIEEIITENRSEYDTFQDGSLYLTVSIAGFPRNACVTRTKIYDIFVLPNEGEDAYLQALSLASQQLRVPLTNIMTVTDQLMNELKQSDDSVQLQAGKINRGLFQLLRIISNMSDAGNFQNSLPHQMETIDLSAKIDEVMEKIQAFTEHSHVLLQYTGLTTPVFGLVQSEKLERAIYNLLSNAIKFSPPQNTVEVKLTKQDNNLVFTVSNYNNDAVDGKNFWNQYQRTPGIEDARIGLGLGMTMVAATATLHKGTVLIDHPVPEQTRVTMRIPIMKDTSGTVRSPILRIGDYAGGRDKALLELSEVLSSDAYTNDN